MEEHFAAFDIHLRPIFLSVADRNVSQQQIDERMKQFSIDMLGLRAKFMEFEEFSKRLWELFGVPAPSSEITPPEPSAPDSAQSEKS